jgi:hypothetical protein
LRRAAVLLALLALALPASSAQAAVGAAPSLQIEAVALPSQFAPSDQDDRYEILVTNAGAAASAEGAPVSVRVTPRANAVVTGIVGTLWAPGHEELSCSPYPRSEAPSCELAAAVPPAATIAIEAEVEVTAAAGPASVAVEVEEGGAVVASEVLETPISAVPAPFAIRSFAFESTAADGSPFTQAAGHPYGQLISLELPSADGGNPEDLYRPARNPRAISLILPPGFFADPLAAARCPPRALEETRLVAGERVVPCPAGSRIGLVTLIAGRTAGALATYSGQGAVSALYDLVPEAGHPAELGFSYQGHAVIFYVDVVFLEGHYALRVSLPGMPIVDLDAIALRLFGEPGGEGAAAGAAAFLTAPDSCAPGASGARLEVDSWEAPREWVGSELPAPLLGGCGQLAFAPRLTVAPRPSASGPPEADAPAGYDLGVAVPEAQTGGEALASPRLRDLAITLPPGVSISPAAAQGLATCAASGPAGIDLPGGGGRPDEAGEGEAIGPDGLSHLAPGNCPAASALGSVEVRTPLLSSPLEGRIYLADPGCGGGGCGAAEAEAGTMLGVYLEVAGEGVDLKLAGRIEVGAGGSAAGLAPGQLRLRFEGLPDLPLSEIDVHLREGPRAPLSTPQTCGEERSSGAFVSWAAPQLPAASAASSFAVAVGAGGGACPAGEEAEPNVPELVAGTTDPLAGAYSPFLLGLSRPDGSRRLGSFSFTLPPGLLARLAGVAECPDAAIAAARARSAEAEEASPSCPTSAQVGEVQIAAGPGPTPLELKGRVYLAGPYKGAPLSLAILTPAVAGPFDLGTVLVRVALRVDEATARVHAVSDPIPQILDGIPLDIRSIGLQLNRPSFTLNPTSCAEKEISGSVTSTLGDVAPLKNRFQVGACAALAFRPHLKLLLSGHTKRAGHPALKAVLTQPKGSNANIARTAVILPKGMLIAQAHVNAPCTRVQFNSTAVPGEACPARSVLGTAKVWTPLLEAPEEGKVYFRSNGRERELPDLVVALRGQIPVQLVGFIDSVGRKGAEVRRVRTRFQSVPDAPVSRFELKLYGGKRGLLENSKSLCEANDRAKFQLTGQNGKTYDTEPLVGVACPKKHKKSSGKRK